MLNRFFILAVLSALFVSTSAFAMDIPGCVDNYAKEKGIKYNVEKPATMIEPIIYCHTVTGSGSSSAIEAASTVNNIVNTYALELYGSALAIRASQVANAGPKSPAALGKKAFSMLGSKDKKAVVQEKVAPNYKDIAKHISQIIELEAQIARLEAATLISREKNGAEYFSKEEDK